MPAGTNNCDRRRITAVVVAIGLLALVLAVLRRGPARPPCLALSLTKTERIEIADDNDVELWLATLSVSNAVPSPGGLQDIIFLRYREEALKVRVANRWVPVKVSKPGSLRAGMTTSESVLVPDGADQYRLTFEYTGGRIPLTFKAMLEAAAEHLPVSLRRRLSYRFWRWVGFHGFQQIPFVPDMQLAPRAQRAPRGTIGVCVRVQQLPDAIYAIHSSHKEGF